MDKQLCIKYEYIKTTSNASICFVFLVSVEDIQKSMLSIKMKKISMSSGVNKFSQIADQNALRKKHEFSQLPLLFWTPIFRV